MRRYSTSRDQRRVVVLSKLSPPDAVEDEEEDDGKGNVGRCRLTVSKPELLKARLVSAINACLKLKCEEPL